jgi:4'-phosphopantetheinyl transferase
MMEVQLWIAKPLEVDELALQAQLPLLSEFERSRYQAFRFAKDRHHYLAAHLLLQRAICNYASIPLDEVRWTALPHQKPYCENKLGTHSIEFSLTHTHGLVACAVAGTPLGIDAEWTGRKYSEHLAQSVLTESEFQRWKQVDAADQADEFFRYWTLKEAYAKGIGKGIAFPFRQIQLEWENANDIVLTILASGDSSRESLEEAGQGWEVRCIRDTSREHVLSLAIHDPCRQHSVAEVVAVDLLAARP